MYCRSEICIDAPKYILSLRNMLSRRHAHVSKTSLYSTIWAPPHERVHNGLVPAPRPLTVLIPGSHRVPVCPKLSPGPAGSRRPLTGHQRVHRSLNAPPCALTVFHRPHKIYHTVAHGRLSRCHVTATLHVNMLLNKLCLCLCPHPHPPLPLTPTRTRPISYTIIFTVLLASSTIEPRLRRHLQQTRIHTQTRSMQ